MIKQSRRWKRKDASNMTIAELQQLAGITEKKKSKSLSNISYTANEKAKIMKKRKIEPGTPEWFKLWFSRPYLTKEKPY
jgi:hypothetical protein